MATRSQACCTFTIVCGLALSDAMTTNSNIHSRLVGWFKILLPLSALALLSTLFLFARAPGEIPAIPFAEIDRLAQEQRISAPRFSGVADDGSTIAITALAAKPESTEKLTIEAPRLSLDAVDGTSLTVQAGFGSVDSAAQMAELRSLARLETSSGYLMETQGLRVNLASGEITSTGPLEIQAPYGEVTAGQVNILTTPDGTGQRMDFTKGVKLVYNPASRNE